MYCIKLKELSTLSSDGIYTMAKIEWWLLKYEKAYHHIKSIEDYKNTILLNEEEVVLPSLINPPSEEEKFLYLYEALEKLSCFHQNENYFKQEMAIYKGIENEPQKVGKWLSKNKRFGGDKYVSFFVDYLNYSLKTNHLKVFLIKDNSENLFVERGDFKYTIEFLKIYCQLDIDKIDRYE
ncbi:hypothetical protein [uncultured Algibacter sp.]|uniref:hypothetical protein n=1 Tax=uncultured Algibacter sp. TaxID=298659 RepID=UPI0026317706|nr:hypothetical protein [uncultured Algibacter sp.]